MHFAFGGIHIECSTYSRVRTRAEDFKALSGRELASSTQFEFLRSYPHRFSPTFYARAIPGGPVERSAYDTFKDRFIQSLKQLLPLQGLYLPMHGALYVEGMEDAEGDWISAAREVLGEKCLISASYDLHGNLSQRIIDNLDLLSAYRTAPHIDVEETMRRACDLLLHCAQEHIQPTLLWTAVPVLLPGERTSTEDQPAKDLYAQLPAINSKPGVLDASLLVGYVWADEPRATASVVMTGTDQALLEEEALQLARQYWDARADFKFGVPAGTISELIDHAQQITTQPVILADSGDNPTGGGVGDRAEVLEELLKRSFENALVAGIADLPATELCYQQAPGSRLALHIGATLDPVGSKPIEVEAEVLFLLPTESPRERCAVIRIAGITVVLTASRRPFHNIKDFVLLGVHPTNFKLVAVKSGYLSPELAPLASPALMALSDGSIPQDLDKLPANRLRAPTFPFDRSFSWRPSAIISARSPQAARGLYAG